MPRAPTAIANARRTARLVGYAARCPGAIGHGWWRRNRASNLGGLMGRQPQITTPGGSPKGCLATPPHAPARVSAGAGLIGSRRLGWWDTFDIQCLNTPPLR